MKPASGDRKFGITVGYLSLVACLIGVGGLCLAPAMAEAPNSTLMVAEYGSPGFLRVEPGLISEFAITPAPGRLWAFDELPIAYGRIDDSVEPQVELGLQACYLGLIRIVEGGIYRFQMNCGGEAVVVIDGLAVMFGGDGETSEIDLPLSVGDHPFRIDYSPEFCDSEITLLFAEGMADFAPIPPSMIFHEISENMADEVASDGVFAGWGNACSSRGVCLGGSSLLRAAEECSGDGKGMSNFSLNSPETEDSSTFVIRYSYDVDGRLLKCESATGISAVELSPAGNSVAISEGGAK